MGVAYLDREPTESERGDCSLEIAANYSWPVRLLVRTGLKRLWLAGVGRLGQSCAMLILWAAGKEWGAQGLHSHVIAMEDQAPGPSHFTTSQLHPMSNIRKKLSRDYESFWTCIRMSLWCLWMGHLNITWCILTGAGDAAEAVECSNHIPDIPEAAAVGSTNGTSGTSSAERSREKEAESGVGLSLEETKSVLS